MKTPATKQHTPATAGHDLLTDADLDAISGGAIYVMIPNVPGDVSTDGYDGGKWFIADSFSFGVEREMKESGERRTTPTLKRGR